MHPEQTASWFEDQIQNDPSEYEPAVNYYIDPIQLQQQADPDSSLDTNTISAAQMKKVMNKWVRQYEQWFFDNFGVELKGISEIDCSPKPASEPVEVTNELSVESIAQMSQAIMSNTLNNEDSSSISKPSIRYDGPQISINSLPVQELSQLPLFHQLSSLQTISFPASLPFTTAPIALADPIKAEEARISAVLAAALLSNTSKIGPNGSAGNPMPWGPVLRYGTYGKLGKNNFGIQFFTREKDIISEAINGSHSAATSVQSYDPRDDWLAPPPPTLILLKKQSLICTLQVCELQ
ncbi:hypothetical protein Ciccas_011568 [Cichlidogyrus casuarinus]|uniref:Uncharacterized protein n=1 Tax=Cichlidogyrus casuarinus TaxID=1844966 RepID=A0ABD2PRS0_9PLAT